MGASVPTLALSGQQLVRADKVRKMQIVVGQIRHAWREPAAERQMYRLVIDLGPVLGMRHLTSVITSLGPDAPEVVEGHLIGKRVLVGCRIEPKTVLGEVSEGLLFSMHPDVEEDTTSCPLFVSEQTPLGSVVW